jgi:hypothetical protein
MSSESGFFLIQRRRSIDLLLRESGGMTVRSRAHRAYRADGTPCLRNRIGGGASSHDGQACDDLGPAMSPTTSGREQAHRAGATNKTSPAPAGAGDVANDVSSEADLMPRTTSPL